MVNRKTVSTLTIAALFACAVPVKSVASSVSVGPVIGQAAPSFSVPTSVEQGTEVTISSASDNMNAISEALKAGFEGEYDNSKVVVETKDANAAIQDVLNGNAELAAISRPLTAEEKAKGLIEVPVRREKIAIVVSKDNPFVESITGSQFAQIFRGEIKDWSEVGGEAGPIKLVDRPATSETRQALSPYPVFTTAPFNASANATTIDSDTTEALVDALGNDGVGYVLVGELAGQSELKALELHKTPPSDPRYPFSQPYSFVYAGGASPSVSAFLGYATGNPGQAAVNDAGVPGLGLIPDATSGAETATIEGAANNTSGSEPNSEPDSDAANPADSSDAVEGNAEDAPDAAGSSPAELSPEGADNGETLQANQVTVAGPDGEINIAGPDGILGTADDVRLAGPDGEIGTPDDIDIAGLDGILGTPDDINLAGPDGAFGTADDLEIDVDGQTASAGGIGRLANRGRWWWLLLPLAGLGLLIWAAGKRGSEEETGYVVNADGDDRIRSNFEGGADFSGEGVNAGLGDLEMDVPGGKVGGAGMNLGKVAAGGVAIAGGTAAASSGLAGRVKDKAGDVTMDLKEGVSGSVKGGIDGIKGSIDGVNRNVQGGIQGGVDGLKGSVQGGVEGIKSVGASGLGAGAAGLGAGAAAVSGLRGKVQGGIDGAKGNVQGRIDGIQGGIDGAKGDVQGRIDGARESAGDINKSVQNEGSSWLDRAKQRINEATEQVKDEASNIKDGLTDKD